MAITVNVNGVPIQYPQTGDTGWGGNATKFAEEVSAVLGKIGQSQSPVNDDIIVSPGNLSVTSGNLSVGGNASVAGTTSLTGNVTLTNNLTVNGIVNVDSGVLYVDPVNNRVGINDTTPSEALDVTGNALISGTLGVTGNSTLTGNLSVNGNTTLGDASGDSLTINSNGVSIPNGLNFDSNTFVIDATNNRVGIGVASPSVPLDIQSNANAIGLYIRGRSSDSSAQIRFLDNSGSLRFISGLSISDGYIVASSSGVGVFNIAQNGQLSAVVPGGSTLYPGYLCRAWVNFNGSTVVSPASATGIRASGNVSSITDNGIGDYTVNFTTAMPDANYSTVCTATDNASNNIPVANPNLSTQIITASVRISVYNFLDSVFDSDCINLAVFR